ncbi:MAG TPA: redoxin family protein [Planctomycetota bacterium]|nr:redoxin family protein [Planctomycetota bacterium]
MKRLIAPTASMLCLLTLPLLAADNPTLALGAAAPDFSLPATDGKTYSLKDFGQARILAVIFNSNHCPTAQAYEDRIIKLTSDYKDKGVAVVVINPNSNKGLRLDELGYTDLADSLPEMKLRAEYKKFNFPYLDDGETQTVSRAYGCKVTPHAFLFDTERKLRYVGRIDDNEREEHMKVQDLRNALEEMLAGKTVSVAQTKATGCSTKWADKEASVKQWMAKVAAEPVTLDPIDEAGLKELRKGNPEKLRLVNFWNTTCGPCVAELPDLVTINLMYRHRAFEMVTVTTNFPDEKKEALAILTKKQCSMKNLIFAGTDKYKHMAAFDPDWDGGIPYTALINTKGEIIKKYNGEIDPLELKRIIVKTLKEMNNGAVMDAPKKK